MILDYKLIKAAGLTKADVARVYGVSRQTVHNWFDGNNVHALIETKVVKITAAVKKAVDAEALPIELPKDVTARSEKLATIIKTYL